VRAAETRATELAQRVEASGTAGIADLDDDIVQVIDDSGRVVAASEDAEDGTLPADREGQVVTYDGEPVVIVVEDVDDDADTRIVLAASVDGDDATLATVAWLLAASTLLVVLVVAAVTWWVVGRALRPVGRIRREVDVPEGEHHLPCRRRVTDARAPELGDALDDRRAVGEVDGDGIVLARGRQRRRLARLPDERLQIGPRERAEVEAPEHGIAELDEPE
jgi:hypothetical protein